MNKTTTQRALVSPGATNAFRDAFVEGLSAVQKTISPKWLYDARGSKLFETITTLPEYYLTRTEIGILEAHANKLASLVASGGALVEFGSGASVKTQILLDAGAHFHSYVPIDISSEFLQQTASALRKRYPRLAVTPVVGDFLKDVQLPNEIAGRPKIGFFPGSTIGNMTTVQAQSLLRGAKSWLNVEGFILGVDLVKDRETLVAAYDDSAGVTAQFIKNILIRAEIELGAKLDPDAFHYHAHWNADAQQIEMSLVSKSAQTICFDEHEFTFSAGEELAVSKSRKFTLESLDAFAADGGWRVEDVTTDGRQQFAVAVLRPI